MPLLRDKDRNPLQAPTEGKAPPELPAGDYSNGHPGVPPKDYKPPEESRR